ncbi:uncharacterized protein LOC134815123 [Bolinopsis microptera]|uniref:uncharacterized protein LOC134815123 n=1 Tax=Bolinopsis microptera TaxID=2820187 RepID=UPI0030795D6F
MTERTLFPSFGPSGAAASTTADETSATSATSATSWLQNSSFPQHLVGRLNSESVQGSVKTAIPVKSSESVKKDSKRRRTDKVSAEKKKKKKKHKKHHSDKVVEQISKFDLYELLYKGDKNNYRYGSLYSYDIPSYKIRIKCCLGDNTKTPYLQAGTKPKPPPASLDPAARYYKRISAPELTLSHRTRFLRINADYISLTVSSSCWEPAEPVLAVLDPSKSQPLDLDRWIQFIQSTGTTKAGLERRYEICQKARKFLPQNLLILKKTIDTAKQFMSNQQIGRVWTDILFHHPNKLDLWLEYLHYKANNLTELNFSSVVAAYRKCFGTLFGFHQGTFRSHVFDGDIDTALTQVAARFIKLLYHMGYTEKATTYCSSLLELSTSQKSKSDFVTWYEKGCTLLGSSGYEEWWKSEVPSHVTETVTQKPDGLVEDKIWCLWLQEEERKENLSSGPTNRRLTGEVIDPECCVTASWLQQFLFTSQKPDLLFESMFRLHLPDNIAHLPFLALFHCQIKLLHNNLEYLMRLCEQMYSRLENQTVIGVFWTLLTHLKSSNVKSTSRFVKGLLKEPGHRNNMTYWSLFTHFTSESHSVLQKLLTTPLSAYHEAVLRNKLALCQEAGTQGDRGRVDSVDSVDREIEELICKPILSTTETLHLGTYATNLFCSNYTTLSPLSPEQGPYLLAHVGRLVESGLPRDQIQVDLLVLFRHVIQTELKRGDEADTNILRKVALLAVEQFPQIQMFWDLLKKHVTMTSKIWERLLKSNQETMWYCRVTHECDKQETHPDINLTNRIISLAVTSVDTFPRSLLLWELYTHISQKYDTKSLKSVLIRSIKENPSMKQFYLQAIHCCPEEAETVYELIEEKQIRLRTLIEEIQMFCQ